MRRVRRMTVGMWLEEWLATYVYPRMRDGELAASTVSSYRGHVYRYLLPELGTIELRRLAPEHVTSLYVKMGTPPSEGGYGLSVRTREITHATLRMALDRAAALGYVPGNVLAEGRGVDRPRVRRRRVSALERDQATSLLAALAADPGSGRRLFVPAVLALATGMRRGEVLALRVDDIDLPARARPRALGRLTVARTWDKRADPTLPYAPIERYQIRQWPKSGRERYIDLSPEVVAIVREAMATRAAAKEAAGGAWQTRGLRVDGSCVEWGELLVCDGFGRPWWPDSFSSAWHQWCVSAGVSCRFHDLRATSGSIALAAGIDAEVVSERLGHHSAAFFLEHYAKALHTARVADAAIMGELVSEALADQTGP